jgi:hypothetical protein
LMEIVMLCAHPERPYCR